MGAAPAAGNDHQSAALGQRFHSASTTSAPSLFSVQHNLLASSNSPSDYENSDPAHQGRAHHLSGHGGAPLHRIGGLLVQNKDSGFISDSPKDALKTIDEGLPAVSHPSRPMHSNHTADDMPIRSALVPEARPLPIHVPSSASKQSSLAAAMHQLYKDTPQQHHLASPPKTNQPRPKSSASNFIDKENSTARPVQQGISQLNKSHNALPGSYGSGEKTQLSMPQRDQQHQPIPLPPPPCHSIAHTAPSAQSHPPATTEESNATGGHQEGQKSSVLFSQLRIGCNNYRVLRHIGSGGFSNVFAVASEVDGKIYALKQVRVPSERHLNEAMREADMLRGLADTGCVTRVYEVAAVRKKSAALMILMELGNADLASWMRSLSPPAHPLPPFPAFVADSFLCRSLFRQMAHAISMLHSRGIVHNDLKPSNWLFTDGCRLKLIDFGVSRQLAVDVTSQVELDKLCGTLDYMSPERLQERRTSPPGDVWALGCILHELAFGMSPFGHLDTALGKISTIVAMPADFSLPLTPRELLHDSCDKITSSEPQLLALIRACLQKAPKSRPTAAELLTHSFFTDHRQPPSHHNISVQEALQVLRSVAHKRPTLEERRNFVGPIVDFLLGTSNYHPLS